MAFEQVVEGLQYARAAGSDLTGKLHYICKLDSSANVVLAAAASDHLLGVIREENTSGNPVTVQFGGIAKVIAGGTVTCGIRVTADSGGKAVNATTGNCVLGVALEAALANEIFSVALLPGSV
jgi:hypothetical protein